ncbi:MAG: NAD-dependent epimerase/dehydratase family protein [Candidatus Hydrogenedentota bacterium]|nr:MAG: NAD-dependent epimerase/dehydratase family protein [Candidatus Hydrogenedentota bacterium]
MEFSGKRILVTGVAGFIGSHLARALLDRGSEVIGVDALTDYYDPARKRRNLESVLGEKTFRFFEEDLNRVEFSRLPVPDIVFHEAAQAGIRASWGGSFQRYVEDNILATQRLLEAVGRWGRIERFVFASSSSVYGDQNRLPLSEDMVPNPISPYGVTKLAAERLVFSYARRLEMPAFALRYFTVYGPRQRPDMAIERFFEAALRGEAVELYGDGSQSRDFTFVDDVVEANLLCLESGGPGGVYNIGGGVVTTMTDLIKEIRRVSERKIEVRKRETAPGDVRHTLADTSRAREDLGFAPKTTLKEGLRRQWDWIREDVAERGLL